MSANISIGELFSIEKGSLQSTKCTPGKYDFITASSQWKTHNEFDHEGEYLIFAAAASGSLGRVHYVNGKFISSDLCYILKPINPDKYPINMHFYHFVFNSLRSLLVADTKSGTSKESINQKNFKKYKLPYFDIEQQDLWIDKLKNTLSIKNSFSSEVVNQQNLLKKLRQQILQDAIEGKLTKGWREQNPDVEPVSELLKRIDAEKQQLIKDKKIKKQKPLPVITDAEKPFELPESWEWCRLGKIITDTDSGWSPKCDEFPAKKGVWGVLKTTAVQRMEFVPSKNKSLPNGLDGRPNIEVKKGDILITRAGPTNRVGICALVREAPSRLMLSDKIIRLHPIKVYGEFIELFIGSGIFQELIKNFKTGMAESQVNISQLNLKRVLIPLLPISEQKEIVKQVEKLFAICDQLEEQITSSQTNAEKLMQSVLKEAFSQDNAA